MREVGSKKLRLVVALVAVAALSACAVGDAASTSPGRVGSPAVSPSLESPTAEAFVDHAIAQGADARQVETLRGIFAAGGEVSMETVTGAEEETFACFADSGIMVTARAIEYTDGFPVPSYSYSGVAGLSDAQSLAVADACIYAHSYFVEELYQTQPQVRETIDRLHEIMRPWVVSCLEDNGAVVGADATMDEVIALVAELVQGGGADCWSDAHDAAVAQVIAGDTTG